MLVGSAWVRFSNRRRFPVRTVLGGLAPQWPLALAVLQTDLGRDLLNATNTPVEYVICDPAAVDS